MNIAELTPTTLLVLGIAGGLVLFLWALVGREFGAGPVRLPRITGKPQRWTVGVMGTAIAAVCLFFLICDLGGSDNGPPPTPLTILVCLAGDELGVFEEITEQFESEHNDKVKVKVKVVVNVENVSEDEALRKLKAGEKVDLVAFNINRRHDLVRLGLIEELTEDNCKGCPPSATDPALAEHLEFDGIRYFMPFRPNVKLVFLNRAEFAGMGTDYPRTWQDVLQVAKKFYERDGEDRVILHAKYDATKRSVILELISSAGGDPLNLLHPQSREALEFLRELWPFISPKSPETDYLTATGFLLADSVYLARNWPYALPCIEEAGRDADFETYAGWSWSEGPKPSYLLGGDLLALPVKSQEKELAIELMVYLMSLEVQETLVGELGWPPMRLDVDITELPPWQQRHQRAMREALRYAEPIPEYWQPELAGIYARLFTEVTTLEPDADIEPTLKRFQAEIDALGIIERQ